MVNDADAIKRVRELLQEGRAIDARQLALGAVQGGRAAPPWYFALALAHAALNELPEAVAAIGKATAAEQRPAWLRKQSQLHRQIGDIPSALKFAELAAANELEPSEKSKTLLTDLRRRMSSANPPAIEATPGLHDATYSGREAHAPHSDRAIHVPAHPIEGAEAVRAARSHQSIKGSPAGVYKPNAVYTVIMAVFNGVEGDSRVIKTAASLHDNGIRVLLVGHLGNANQPGVTELAMPYHSFPCVLIHGTTRRAKGQPRPEFLKTLMSEFTVSLAKLIEQHRAEIVHTHDMLTIGIGADLKRQFAGRKMAWLHDLHEWVEGLTNIDPGVRDLALAEERRAIHGADHLFTVTPQIATIDAEAYALPSLPTVVLNAPLRLVTPGRPFGDIRSALSLAPETPLGVYCGGVKDTRGILEFTPVLAKFPDLHLALITNSSGPYVDRLVETARAMNAGDRLHFHAYVPGDAVPSFLSTATFGFHPLLRYGNGDVALPTKLFEYIHAGLPIVVSDAQAMAAFVTEHRIGAVFQSENVTDAARAVGTVLESGESLRPTGKLMDEFCWEEQEEKLLAAYAPLLSVGKIMTRRSLDAGTRRGVQRLVPSRHGDGRLLVLHGPKPSAGQPGTLARSLTERSERYRGASISIVLNYYRYSVDLYADLRPLDPTWRLQFLDRLIDTFDIFHFHAATFFWSPPDWPVPSLMDMQYIKASGRKVVFHYRGSEARVLSQFAKLNPHGWSDNSEVGLSEKLTVPAQEAMFEMVRASADRICVIDQELAGYVPDAQIINRVLPSDWQPAISRRTSRPLIVHAPTRRLLKGSDAIERAIAQLADEGLDFDFRCISGMSHQELRHVLEQADIVVDQCRLGWYGVLAVEGMALGKAVVSYVRPDLVRYLGVPHPIANANPANLADVLRHLIVNPRARLALADAAVEYFRKTHAADVVARQLDELYDDLMATSDKPQDVRSILRRTIGSAIDPVHNARTLSRHEQRERDLVRENARLKNLLSQGNRQ